jgi:hypothetical protein
MSLATTVRAMELAGCTAKQIADVVVAHQEAEETRRSEKRAADAARQRKSRASRNVTVTPCDIDGHRVTEAAAYTEDAHTHAEPEPNKTTSSPVQKDILTDIPKVSIAKPSCDDLGFTETWVAYPRRQGGNSRKNAETRYRKAVKSGVDPADILAGVLAYAAHCDATGKTGTEFVKTAEAWLNGRFWESDWSISLSRAPPPRQASNRRSLIDALHRTIPDEQPDQQFYPRLAFGG